MKMMINDNTCNPSNARGAPGRAGAILAWLALVLSVPSNCLKAQAFAISNNAVLLSWPEPATEQIVIGASSLNSNAVWSPWPEPIFKRFGELCMAVSINTNQNAQFFKLVPGTQFIDEFSDAKQPFATRNQWVPWFYDSSDTSRFSFTVTNGVFRIQTLSPPVAGGVAIFPPGTNAILRDFHASVDILDWGTNNTASSGFGIGGRVQGGPAYVQNFYLGTVRLAPTGIRGTAALMFFNGDSDVQATSVFNLASNAVCRLEFSAVGNQLKVRLLNLSDPTAPVRQGTLQASMFTQGPVCLWVNTRDSSSYARTVDNFFVTGTKP